MSAQQPSTGDAPSADTLKERVDQLGAESKLGSGSEEPDPATAEDPPQDLKKGDSARDPD